MANVKLKCECGSVRGIAHHVTPRSGTRIVCCCDDCQAFANYLGKEGHILDEYGGTDIFQMPISHVEITEGKQNIRCIRLTSKGMFRWYTDCCNTPIGNTLAAPMPFIGVIHSFMDNLDDRNHALGAVRGYVNTKFAKKQLPAGYGQSAFPINLVFRIISKMILWKSKGLNKPSPFFDDQGTPCAEPNILNPKPET